MSTIPQINLCVMQPSGQVHALGLLDAALYFRWMFHRLGAMVHLSKNRLRHNAVNFVFGAHLGFDPALRRTHSCVFVNLEQIGESGAQLRQEYLQLLQGSAVVDYDTRNVATYAPCTEDVPLISFGHAAYLQLSGGQALPLAERPIDLLFIGSMNERRRRLIERIEATGRSVTMFDGPLYGPERDAYVAQAKAMLNCHFYESARFEQVRAFQSLSLGTPIVSERCLGTRPDAAFDRSVEWFDSEGLEAFFGREFGSAAYFERAQAQVDAFRAADPVEAYADLLAFSAGLDSVHRSRRGTERNVVRRLHLGSGKDYRMGWLNIDVLESAKPDAVLDLCRPLMLPQDIDSPQAGPVRLAAGEVEIVYANNVLEHVSDLPGLMTRCLELLKVGGVFQIEVPYERAPTAWQDPTHVRALNENSWIYYTDWFWYLGWFEHRFALRAFDYLDAGLQPSRRESAAFMRVSLEKVPTTLHERMAARTMRADFGPGLPGEDVPRPREVVAAVLA
ncbi:MAG: hypothetical protein JSR49_05175 [Proteobacteria bacterium]|nr:hypothetical protein [Pseudomonadota bacterium]